MRIYLVDTLEGIKIPFIMAKPGLSLRNLGITASTIWTQEQTFDYLDLNESDFYKVAGADSMVNQMVLGSQNGFSKANMIDNNGSGTTSYVELLVGTDKPPYSTRKVQGYGAYEIATTGIDTYTRIIVNLQYKVPSGDVVSSMFDASIGGSHTTVTPKRGAVRLVSGEGAYPYNVPAFIIDDYGQFYAVGLTTSANGCQVIFQVSSMSWDKSSPGPSQYELFLPGTITGGDIPVPPIKGGGIVDLTNRFSPRISTSGLGIYPLDRNSMNLFLKDMWVQDVMDKLLYSIKGNPMDSIIAVRWYYGLRSSIPTLPVQAYVTLGDIAFNGNIASDIRTYPASSEYLTFSCGYITVPRYFNNFLDFSPFTYAQLYIPYVGFVPIHMTDIVGRNLRLDYNVNVVTGATIAYVYVSTADNTWRISMEIPCQIGMDIPMNVQAQESLMSRMISTITGATAAGVGIGLGAATMGAGGVVAAGVAMNAGNNAVSQSGIGSSGQPDMRRSGGINSETGSLAYLKPFLLINRPIPAIPSDYNEYVGLPSTTGGRLGNKTGYIKVAAIKHNDPGTIPKAAMDEIESLLRSGVYIS